MPFDPKSAKLVSGFDPASAKPYVEPAPNPLWDAIRSAPGGFLKGVTSLAGTGGDLRSLALSPLPDSIRKPVDATMRVLPVTMLGGSTSAELDNAVTAPTGGYYEPKTDAGRFTQTAASFAPAVFGGPESLATRIGQRVLLPAAGATIGRKIGGDTGELVGTVAGGIGPAGLRAAATSLARNAAQRAAIPTINQLKSAATHAYNVVDNSGMLISKGAMGDLLNIVQRDLAKEGFHPKLQPNTAIALDELTNAAANNQTLKGMDIVRRVAQNAVNPLNKSDSRLTRRVVDHIDDFVTGLVPRQVIGPVDQGALNALGNARDLWARAAKAQIIETTIAKAQLNTHSMVGDFAGFGYGKKLQTAFRQLANNPRGMARFSKDEQDAIRRVATGGPTERVLRLVGKLSPDQAIPMLSEGGLALAHPGPALATAIAGLAGKAGSTALTARSARLASELMRGGAFARPPTRQMIGATIQPLLRGAAQAAPALGILSAPMLANVTN